MNQTVAANLRQIRKERGWTQEEAGIRLKEFLGESWSAAVWSAAERSVDGKRVRHFDADVVSAFAQLFDVPESYFFTGVIGPQTACMVRTVGVTITEEHLPTCDHFSKEQWQIEEIAIRA